MALDETVQCLQNLDRYVNILETGDKTQKKHVFRNLSEIVARESSEKTMCQLYDKLETRLVVGLQDSMEFAREGSLNLLKSVAMKFNLKTDSLVKLIPALYCRLCRERDFETSEELRLIIGEILIILLEKQGSDLAPFSVELTDMTVRLVRDPSPDVKQVASKLCRTLVDTLPRETHGDGKKMIPPLIENLQHQRWRVRKSVVEALEWVMMKGDNKWLPEVAGALAKRMFDESHHVRGAVAHLCGLWLVQLPQRYSYFPYIIPIALTCLTDSNEIVLEESLRLWKAAGDTYYSENEKELKDRNDYLSDKLSHYPPGVERPSLGCRALVEREASKFLLALGAELTDWSEPVRIKSSVLLTQVTLHYEFSLTQGISRIIMQMCRAAMDRDTPAVVTNVKLAAEYMGYFVLPEVYCELIVMHMKEATPGELRIVASLVRGSRRDDLVSHLEKVCSLIIRFSVQLEAQNAALELIAAIMSVCQEDCLKVGADIWKYLIGTIGLAQSDIVADTAMGLLHELVQLGGGSPQTVHNLYCHKLLEYLGENTTWSVHCHEQYVLVAVINYAGEIFDPNFNTIVDILKKALSPESDPEVHLKIIFSINQLLTNTSILGTQEKAAKFVRVLLTDILAPHLRWRAGLSAEAVRTVACTCLYMCLKKAAALPDSVKVSTILLGQRISNPRTYDPTANIHDLLYDDDVTENSMLPPIFDPTAIPTVASGINDYAPSILPLVLSLTEDAAPKTRLLAIASIKILSLSSLVHDMATFSTVVAAVLKRLDDADDGVRAQCVLALKTLYEHELARDDRDNERCPLNRSLVDFVYGSLLVHLDDRNKKFQKLILDCLKVVSAADPETLRQKVKREDFRDQKICDELIQFVNKSLAELNMEKYPGFLVFRNSFFQQKL